MIKTKKQENKKTNNRNCFFVFLLSCKGYFLINLIVTIGVVGILAAVTAPTLRAYLPALRLRNEARALINELRDAQQRTVTQQVVHYVVIDQINQRYQLFRDDNPDTLIHTTALENGITVQSITALPADTVSFNSYGAVSAAGSIVLVNGLNATSTISIKPSGYVQLQ